MGYVFQYIRRCIYFLASVADVCLDTVSPNQMENEHGRVWR